MSVLDRIADSTRRRVAAAKAVEPIEAVRARAVAAPPPRDFRRALVPGPSVIAEVKLASPSEGALGRGLDPVALAREYASHGAAAISVLTEPEFFAGDLAYLAAIRKAVTLPLIMKDFVLDEYQLWQGRAAGADCALLIVALVGAELPRLMAEAKAAGLQTLVEVHDEPELETALAAGAPLIGVNNRSLKTLAVDLGVSRRLAPRALSGGAALVCESGIKSRAEVESLAGAGFSAFLVGTSLVKSGRPGPALAELLGRTR